jgi:hypothetical protein
LLDRQQAGSNVWIAICDADKCFDCTFHTTWVDRVCRGDVMCGVRNVMCGAGLLIHDTACRSMSRLGRQQQQLLQPAVVFVTAMSLKRMLHAATCTACITMTGDNVVCTEVEYQRLIKALN